MKALRKEEMVHKIYFSSLALLLQQDSNCQVAKKLRHKIKLRAKRSGARSARKNPPPHHPLCSPLFSAETYIYPKGNQTMSTFTSPAPPSCAQLTTARLRRSCLVPAARATSSCEATPVPRRRVVGTLLATSLTLLGTPLALAENWGTRSFIRERFFEPGLSPEDAVARIRQTAQGLHSLRHMLETMSWRYVIFYIRLKSAYLSQDLKNAMTTLPEGRRRSYVNKANELVDNMAEVSP